MAKIIKDYNALCLPHVPFTVWLFGDDLQKQLKDIGDENKIGAHVLPVHKPSYGTLATFTTTPNQMFTNAKESQIVAQEIDKLLCKGVIQKVHHTEGKFLSNVFLRLKKDGSYRLILNLKNLNQYVTYKHFKMETLASALQLIKTNC